MKLRQSLRGKLLHWSVLGPFHFFSARWPQQDYGLAEYLLPLNRYLWMTGILDLHGKLLHQLSWDLFYNYISLSVQPCSTEMLTSCEHCQIGRWQMSPSSWITRIFARAAAVTFMCRQHLEAMCFTLSQKIQLSFTSFTNVILWMPSTFILHLLHVVISHVRSQIAVSMCIAPWRQVCSLFIRHCNVCWRWMHCWNIATAPK